MRYRVLAFAFCAVTATLPCVGSAQVLSPGPLASSHKSLEGDDNCLQCHSSGKRVDTQLCTHCHSDIGRELQKSLGLHGHEYRNRPCGECHVEHRGAQHDLVRWPGGSRERFDHRLTGWVLEGKHAQVTCAKCHTAKNERGASTFLGQATSCSSCHKDPHEKRLGTSCDNCHNEQGWKSTDLTGFNHALTSFPLKGQHQKVECKSCHGTPPQTKYHPIAAESCTNCHKDPHHGQFSQTCTSCHSETSWSDVHMGRESHPGLSLSGGHSKVKCETCHDKGNDHAPSKGDRCVSCHAPIHEAPFGNDCARCHKRIEWLGVADSLALEVHGKTAFPLRGDHASVACDRCHSPKRPLEQRYRKLEFARCLDCHEDAHRGEFSQREGGGDCAKCHDERGFTPVHFGLDAHALTAFPLIGRHTAVACLGCHQQAGVEVSTAPVRAAPNAKGAPEVQRLNWLVTGQRCADCHADPHAGQFAKEMASDGCAHCHTPNAWNVPNIDHSTWPLTGAHSSAACESCHAGKEGEPNASYRGLPRDCEGCHDDVHAGQFRLEPPLRVCTDCHTTQTFALPQFDHRGKTRYPLEGSHLEVPCAGCHRPDTLHNGSAVTRYRLGYSACADCHRNPHGQEAP